MVSSLADILLAPDISIDVNVDKFNFQSIPDTLWETVTIDLPEEPVILFPARPIITDPDQPIAPDISLDDLSEQQLQSLEIETACQDRVDIVLPKKLTLREWTDEVPSFIDPIPDGVVDWQYEEFSYALTNLLLNKYNLLILPTEYFSRLMQRNGTIWDTTLDALVQRGQDNSYLGRKNLDIKRAVYTSRSFVVIENYKNDLILKKLFISGRQAHEEMLRQHHDVKQKLNFSFVQSVMENSLKHFNACVQAFNAQIETYRELASVYIGDIARQGIIIQELQGRLGLSEGLSQYNTGVLRRLNAQISTQKGVILFFQSQMQLAKAELRVEVLQVQVQSLEVRIFAELNKALVKELEVDIAEQEAEISKTRVIRLEAIKQRLLAEVEKSQVDLDSAKNKFIGDRDAFNITQQARSEQHGDFPAVVTAREKLLQAQVFFDEARGSLFRSITSAQLDELQFREARLTGKFVRDISEAKGTTVIDKLIAENSSVLAKARVEARKSVRQAELAAQDSLAKADLIQNLTHEISLGS